ncbi:MAG: CPBP family intramembrane glutamic endopeptidase [Melioribacteraceae bacterium]|nr:CPBP family intramembrane glutamic endopeptidase [Melioribacteraceae bacterium]
MWKFIKSEIDSLSGILRSLDVKSVVILLSSTFLFVISWYYANPLFFLETFTFLEPEEFIVQELVAHIYWFLLDFILFFLIPLYIVKLSFREDLKSFGITFGNKRAGVFYTIISILIFIPIIYLISNTEDYSKYFPLMQSAKSDLLIFIIYEVVFILFIFSWEFVFRGYMLFGLEKKFGFYSILIQMIPFVLLHNGKPFLETIASVLGAIFLGYLALRTRSVIYGFIIHALILVILDILAYVSN